MPIHLFRTHLGHNHMPPHPIYKHLKATLKTATGNISLAIVQDFVDRCPAPVCVKRSQKKKQRKLEWQQGIHQNQEPVPGDPTPLSMIQQQSSSPMGSSADEADEFVDMEKDEEEEEQPCSTSALKKSTNNSELLPFY
jgi:hypothetical protein